MGKRRYESLSRLFQMKSTSGVNLEIRRHWNGMVHHSSRYRILLPCNSLSLKARSNRHDHITITITIAITINYTIKSFVGGAVTPQWHHRGGLSIKHNHVDGYVAGKEPRGPLSTTEYTVDAIMWLDPRLHGIVYFLLSSCSRAIMW